MAEKTLKLRAWTKDDVRMLKSLAREKNKNNGDRSQTETDRRCDLSAGA
jgi:hypothetical protein